MSLTLPLNVKPATDADIRQATVVAQCVGYPVVTLTVRIDGIAAPVCILAPHRDVPPLRSRIAVRRITLSSGAHEWAYAGRLA